MSCTPDPIAAANLRRWKESGWPRRWVEAREGAWGHDDWLALLDALPRSDFWPLDPQAVGAVLEDLRRPYDNLRRWRESGAARKWVEARLGRGGHDMPALLQDLRPSEFWPLDPAGVREVFVRMEAECWNLRRWLESGAPRLWVEARQGAWGHEDWLALLDALRRSEFWPVDAAAVGELLEQLRRQYGNLRRWQESGAARRWAEAYHGQRGHEDWPALLEALRRSEFWPLDPGAAWEALVRLKAECRNLHRWRESGAPRKWVEARQGQWGHDDWLALLGDLRQSGLWPVDTDVLSRVLLEHKQEWWNLRRWRDSGLARQWVEARQGQWGHDDWLALLHGLTQSEFWPADTASVRRVLEEVTTEWWNLRRWQQSGQPRVWVESRPGPWTQQELRSLLDSLRRSEFWPLDATAVRHLLEGLSAPERQAA